MSLLFFSTQSKFSFYLSSSLIGLLASYEILKRKYFSYFVCVNLILFLVIIFPRELFDFLLFSKDYIKNFFNPVSDNFLSNDFVKSLKGGDGNSRIFPIWIFFPIKGFELKFGLFTEILGVAILIFLINIDFKNIYVKKTLLIFVAFFVFALIFGQPKGRFFIEPFLWVLTVSIIYIKRSHLFNIAKKIILLSSIFYVCTIIYLVLSYFPSYISKANYERYMRNNADGFLLYEWANKVLPDKAVIISTHRSNALYKHKVIPYEFRLVGNSKNKKDYYLSEIIKDRPSYILYTSTQKDNSSDILSKCRSKLFAYKKNVGYITGRNPFNKKNKYYDGYIYEINEKDIKKCIN